MSNIAEAGQRALVQAAPDQSVALLSMIERVALNPEADISKLERLMEMAKGIRADQARVAYGAALAEMQAELPVVGERGGIKDKGGKITSTYALWEDVNRALLPVLRQYGFSISFRTASHEKGITVTGVLTHRDGHAESTTIDLPADQTGSKNGVQAIASSISYGQRYTARALLNFSTANDPADDDGQGAGGTQIEYLTEEQAKAFEARALATKTSTKKIFAHYKVEGWLQIPAACAQDIENILIERERTIATTKKGEGL